MFNKKGRLPSIDAKAYSCRRGAELGSFLDFLFFRGGDPIRGGGPGIVGAAQVSVGKRRPYRGSLQEHLPQHGFLDCQWMRPDNARRMRRWRTGH